MVLPNVVTALAKRFDVKRRTRAVIAQRAGDASLVAIVVVAVRIGAGNLDGMRPDDARAARGIGIGASCEPTVRQDVADLIIGIGARNRGAAVIRPRRTDQPIQGVIPEVLVPIDRIGDQIHIAISRKLVGEVLIERIRSLLSLKRAELKAIGRNTGRMPWIGKGVGGHDSIAVKSR